jgi:hypothetical protein
LKGFDCRSENFRVAEIATVMLEYHT